jgi:hypothetical protein
MNQVTVELPSFPANTLAPTQHKRLRRESIPRREYSYTRTTVFPHFFLSCLHGIATMSGREKAKQLEINTEAPTLRTEIRKPVNGVTVLDEMPFEIVYKNWRKP